MDLANLVVITFAVFVFLIVLTACCRGLRHACESHFTNSELARRRGAMYLSQVNRNHPVVHGDTRVVRVATIEGGNNHVAYEVYEIQFPQRQTARSNHGGRRHRTRRTRSEPELLTPPPPFRTALEVSTPVANSYSQQIDLEEPPPSYEDYLKFDSMQCDVNPVLPVRESPERY